MQERVPRRLCLLAGYDASGLLHDYVLHLARALSSISEVHYYSDGSLAEGEAGKLEGIAEFCGDQRHSAYDFGSWARMIQTIGWSRIAEYDELILVNDSCYGPFHPLPAVFDAMAKQSCDFWGMTGSREIAFHIQSYFCVFRKGVLQSPEFRAFWEGVKPQASYELVVETFEVGLSRLLIDRGFACATYVRSRLNENLTLFPLSLVRDRGMPFIKVKCFRDPYIASRERISLLFRHLRRTSPHMARMIAAHQGQGFLHRAILAQKRDEPVYVNAGWFRIRSIRNQRLKIVILDRWRIILALGPRLMRAIARMRCVHARF